MKRFLPSGVDRFSKFPVRKTREEVEHMLRGRKIHTACPALYQRALADIKPYLGGDDSIFYLHELDISDKHTRSLFHCLVTAPFKGVSVKNKKTGEIFRFGIAVMTRPGPYFIDLPEVDGGWYIEDKGQVSREDNFRKIRNS